MKSLLLASRWAPWAALVSLLTAQPAAAGNYAGAGVGPIPDGVTSACDGGGFGAPLDVTFHVVGEAAIQEVAVSIGLVHPWVGDLDVVLIAPSGESHVLFSRVGATEGDSCGDGSDLLGVYEFDDGDRPHLWYEASVRNALEALAPGKYRTTAAGGAGQYALAPVTRMGAAFSGIANPNGTWTLRFRDTIQGDIGSVNGATLSLNPPCVDDLVIPPGPVSGSFVANGSVTHAGWLRVVGTGATLRGREVALGNDFRVDTGAPFTVETPTSTCYRNPGGVIPDADPYGLELLFPVSGLSQLVSRVLVRLEATHSWVGDLTATLISPGGVARLVLLGRPGHRPAFAGGLAGVQADLQGVYLFDDFAPGDLWDTIAGLGGGTIPSGAYRTSTAARVTPAEVLSNAGGCATYLSGAFAGLTAAQANGLWTLRLVDAASGDLGWVGAATLFIEESPELSLIPIQGSAVRGLCTRAQFDFSGSGRTSYSLARDVSGAIHWLVKENDGTEFGGPWQTFVLGNAATDELIPDDYDGDGICDAAVWRPGPDGTLIARRSSRPADVPLELRLGRAGDDPRVSGDYDGDGVADPAVFWKEAYMFIYLASSFGGVTGILLTPVGGPGASLDPGFDRTGDGAADIGFLSAGAGGVAHWTVLNGATGAVVEEFDFGRWDDWILPGNFAGNEPAGHELGDTTVARMVTIPGLGSVLVAFTRDTGNGTGGDGPGDEIIFGLPSDQLVVGDFDGDGLDDLAVWRYDEITPGNSRFVIRRSSSPEPPLEFFFSVAVDGYPPAASKIH